MAHLLAAKNADDRTALSNRRRRDPAESARDDSADSEESEDSIGRGIHYTVAIIGFSAFPFYI